MDCDTDTFQEADQPIERNGHRDAHPRRRNNIPHPLPEARLRIGGRCAARSPVPNDPRYRCQEVIPGSRIPQLPRHAEPVVLHTLLTLYENCD